VFLNRSASAANAAVVATSNNDITILSILFSPKTSFQLCAFASIDPEPSAIAYQVSTIISSAVSIPHVL
jgi:hypothetical protein